MGVKISEQQNQARHILAYEVNPTQQNHALSAHFSPCLRLQRPPCQLSPCGASPSGLSHKLVASGRLLSPGHLCCCLALLEFCLFCLARPPFFLVLLASPFLSERGFGARVHLQGSK